MAASMTRPDTQHAGRSRVRLDRALGVTALLAVAAALLGVAIAQLIDVPVMDISEDPAAINDTNPLVGALSNLGILVWWTAAVAALLTCLVLRRVSPGTEARFFLLGGLISVYLAVDDLYLIHDYALTASPIPQPAFLGVMVLVVVWWVWSFRELVARTEWLILVTAGLFFLGSLGIDFVDDLGKYLDAWEASSAVVYVEDVFKWFGVVAWTTYFVRTSVSALDRTVVRAGSAIPAGRTGAAASSPPRDGSVPHPQARPGRQA